MIFKTKFITDTKPMLDWISANRKVRPKGRGTGDGIGAQYDIKPNFPTFKPLVDKIHNVAHEVAGLEFDPQDPYRSKFKPYTIMDIWVNYSVPGSSNASHNHQGTHVAGCWYLDIPEDSGTIQFETGEEFLPEAGDLLYWDARLYHWVNENKSKQDRISIAFSIFIRDFKFDEHI
jgi:hypothetical protein